MRTFNFCLGFAGAALLVACATPAPAPTPAQAQTQTQTGEKFSVPVGYQKVMMNGQERYCRNDLDTGSHISRSKVCYTMAQLQAEAADTQNSIQNQLQNNNGLGSAVGSGGPGGR